MPQEKMKESHRPRCNPQIRVVSRIEMTPHQQAPVEVAIDALLGALVHELDRQEANLQQGREAHDMGQRVPHKGERQ